MTRRDRTVVIHAHFYQPPREDPWLEAIPPEPSAAPAHDWNARIERECYRAVTAARVPAPDGRIVRIVNTLARVSFDAGPTLMSWMERTAPDTYGRFLAADRASVERLEGHGNAIAAPYHHVILPLATRRDKRTEVRWGLADFRRRFGRDAEGCWLPETAVDDETLDVLAECGVRYTILAPHQVTAAPPRGHPGRYRTAGGRDIAVAVYDGALSHDVAFGPLVRDGARWAAAVASSEADLVGIATDGETYGHHHRFGEMALAAVLANLDGRPGFRVENYAAWLHRHPATHPVQLVTPSSWSCAHGFERWRSDCGCRLEPDTWPSQAWRAPLRTGLTELQEQLHARFADEGGTLLRDPWGARDAYGAVLSGVVALNDFLDEWAPGTGAAGRERATALLEMERHALGMMTSCGWFFDDVSGLESLQVLRYAARAMELAGPAGDGLERSLLTHLDRAASNDRTVGTAQDLYRARVLPLRAAPARVAAGAAGAHALGIPAAEAVPDGYAVEELGDEAVTVRHRRAGVARRIAVRVERPRPGRIEITTGDADIREPIPLAALPEAARTAIVTRLRREVMDLWFTEAEAAALCNAAPVGDVLERALRRAVTALAADAGPMATAQVLDLLDLASLCGLDVPHGVQTLFADLRPALPADAADRATTIAHHLGFS